MYNENCFRTERFDVKKIAYQTSLSHVNLHIDEREWHTVLRLEAQFAVGNVIKTTEEFTTNEMPSRTEHQETVLVPDTKKDAVLDAFIFWIPLLSRWLKPKYKELEVTSVVTIQRSKTTKITNYQNICPLSYDYGHPLVMEWLVSEPAQLKHRF